MERKIIILLTLILVGIGMTSCNKPSGISSPTNTPDESPIVKIEPEDTPTVSNMSGIAYALGCMFAPNTCEAKKDLGKTEDK